MVQMVYIRISSKADIKISLKADEEGKKNEKLLVPRRTGMTRPLVNSCPRDLRQIMYWLLDITRSGH